MDDWYFWKTAYLQLVVPQGEHTLNSQVGENEVSRCSYLSVWVT